jgi:hypothetical protein
MCVTTTPSRTQDLVPNEEAAQAQMPNEEAALALIELQTSSDDDATGRLFKKGRALPLPTEESDFIYPLNGGRRMTTLFDTSDVPKELKNLRSEKWKDSQFLRQTFKVPSKKSAPASTTVSTTSALREIDRNTSTTKAAKKKKAPLSKKKAAPKKKKNIPSQPKLKMLDVVFPPCLILGAKNLHDRLFVLNWWANLSKPEQAGHKKKFGIYYQHPTISPSPAALRQSAAGAFFAEQENLRPRVVSILESQDQIEEFLESTNSKRTFDGTKKNRRRKNEIPNTEGEVFDRHFSSSKEQLEKKTRELFDTTIIPPGMTSSIEVVSILKTKEPYKNGRGGPSARTGDDFNFETKHQVYARNETACLSILGDPEYYALQSQGALFWFYDNQDMLPESVIRSSRKSVLPSEESFALPPSPSAGNDSSSEKDWDDASCVTQPPILPEGLLF